MSDNILNMDFGEFIPIEEDDIDTPKYATDEDIKSVKEENFVDNDPVEEETEDNINDILGALSEGEVPENKEKEQKESPAPSKKEIETPSSEPFTLVFAKFMKEQGLLSDFNEEDLNAVVAESGEAEALSQLMSGELQRGKEFLKTEYDQFSQEYINLRESGVDSETAKAAVFDLEKISTISETDLDDEDNEGLRKEILREHYKSTTRFTDARIDKLINRSADLGDDIEESKSALEELKEIKKENIKQLAVSKEAEQKTKVQEYNDSLKALRTAIEAKDSIIPDRKLNKQVKDKLNDMLTKPAKTLDSGQVLNAVWAKRHENPMEFDITLAYLVNSGVFEGNFKGLVTGAKTKATQELEKVMKEGSLFSKGSYRSTVQSDKKEQDMIEQMKSIFK